MQGLMQQWPLLCSKVIDHAATYHPLREVVSRSVEGPMHRTNYREVRARAMKLAQRLEPGLLAGHQHSDPDPHGERITRRV